MSEKAALHMGNVHKNKQMEKKLRLFLPSLLIVEGHLVIYICLFLNHFDSDEYM